MRAPSYRSGRDSGGFAGGVEAIAAATLVFVAGMLLVAGAWGAVDAKTVASDAAREAVRAFVEQVDGPGSAEAAARRAADEVIAASGRDPARLSLSMTGGAGRCRRLVIEAAYPVRLGSLPFLGGGTSVTVRARHAEVVDAHRSGLPGEAVCGA